MVEYDDCSNAGHGHMFPEFHSDTPTTDPRAYQVINPIPLQGKISKYLPSKPTVSAFTTIVYTWLIFAWIDYYPIQI